MLPRVPSCQVAIQDKTNAYFAASLSNDKTSRGTRAGAAAGRRMEGKEASTSTWRLSMLTSPSILTCSSMRSVSNGVFASSLQVTTVPGVDTTRNEWPAPAAYAARHSEAWRRSPLTAAMIWQNSTTR